MFRGPCPATGLGGVRRDVRSPSKARRRSWAPSVSSACCVPSLLGQDLCPAGGLAKCSLPAGTERALAQVGRSGGAFPPSPAGCVLLGLPQLPRGRAERGDRGNLGSQAKAEPLALSGPRGISGRGTGKAQDHGFPPWRGRSVALAGWESSGRSACKLPRAGQGMALGTTGGGEHWASFSKDLIFVISEKASKS